MRRDCLKEPIRFSDDSSSTKIMGAHEGLDRSRGHPVFLLTWWAELIAWPCH